MALHVVLLVVLLAAAGAGLAFLFLGQDGPGSLAARGEHESGPTADAPATLAGRGVDLSHQPLDTLLQALLDDQSEPVPETVVALRERASREPDLAASLVRRLTALLDRGSWDRFQEQMRILRALAALGEDGARALLPLLEDPTSLYWGRVVPYVAWFGGAGSVFVPTLVAQAESMRGRGSQGLEGLLWHLGQLGPTAAPAVGLLTSMLTPPLEDAHVRSAAQVLVAITGPTEETLALLRGVIEDPDTEARSSVIWAVGQLGSEAASFVPTLVELLQDPEAATRSASAQALGDIGVATPEVLRELAFLLVDDHQKYTAAAALAQLGHEGTAVLLETAQNAESIDTRVRGLQVYLSMGGDVDAALPVWLDIMSADVERGWKAQVLGMLRWLDPLPEDEAFVRALVVAAGDPVLRSSAYPVLLKLSGGAGEAVVTDHALRAASPEDRFVAVQALVQQRPPPPATGEALLGLAGADLSRQVKTQVLDWFRLAEPPIPLERGLSILRPLLDDEDRYVAYAALRATLALAGDRASLLDLYVQKLDSLDLRVIASAGLAMDTAFAERTLPPLIARATRDAAEFGYVGGDVSGAIARLAPHWKGTKQALEAAAESSSGEARKTLLELRDSL